MLHKPVQNRRKEQKVRFWIVKKDETVEAIFKAIENGTCTTEAQAEAIAAAHGDTVKWASPSASGLEEV